MRNLFSLFVLVLVSIVLGCNTKNKSAEVATYKYTEKQAETNSELKRKIGDWLENGIECYGLVVAVNTQNIEERGKPVKAKVLNIAGNEVKMEALENVNIAASEDCPMMGLSIGETWMEKEGELFKTKEEAVAYLKSKGLFMGK